MKQELLLDILKYLIYHDDYISGKELSTYFHVSEKTILKWLF